MKNEQIEQYVQSDQLRKRKVDKEKIKSMIEASITNMDVVKAVPLNEKSAILIFRETYESIRQLGDVNWWLLGYEPRNHEVSMEILKEMDIKEKLRLFQLSRFKKIRNDANYRGFKVSVLQAIEILDFWNLCSKEIIAFLFEKLK